MNAFEIFLLSPLDAPADVDRILSALRKNPWIRAQTQDPSRLLYHDRDTGVFFQLWCPLLAGGDAEVLEEEESGEAEEEPASAGPTDATDPEDESSGAEDAVSVPPVTITVPLACPGFFGREAAAAAAALAAEAGLELELAGEVRSGDSIAHAWEDANARAIQNPAQKGLAVWPQETCDAWYRYGKGRTALAGELEAAGIAVPRLQAARFDGQVATLCAWAQGTPTVLPRTRLVLVTRERVKRGLLLTRKVREEGLAAGDRIWEILAPFSERRESPVELLIYREASLPQEAAAELEVLELLPLDDAKRTELLGIVEPGSTAPAGGTTS